MKFSGLPGIKGWCRLFKDIIFERKLTSRSTPRALLIEDRTWARVRGDFTRCQQSENKALP